MYGTIIIGLWLAFIASWIAASFWATRPEKNASRQQEAAYRITLVAGVLIFAIPARRIHGALHLWYLPISGLWACIALIAAGFAFCWWARIHLGQLWSSTVTKKQDHHIVETGPYGLVRHPIYTGLILAVLATALAKGTLPGLAGAAVIIFSFWLKARLEERFLRAELGAAGYDDYRRRVPMLVPFI